MDGYSSENPESLKASIYRFLQKLFIEPDEEFLNFLQQNSKELEDIGIEFNGSLNLENLQMEYTRLFLGPKGHMPPYESVFLEGRLWGNSASEIKNFIRGIGLELEKDINMPPDHISIEFEILEKIISSKDVEINGMYIDFLKRHVAWIFDFLTQLILKTELKFYQTSFAFSKVFLKEEMATSSRSI